MCYCSHIRGHCVPMADHGSSPRDAPEAQEAACQHGELQRTEVGEAVLEEVWPCPACSLGKLLPKQPQLLTNSSKP